MKNYATIFLMIILGLLTGAEQAIAGGAASNDNFAGAMPLVLNNGTIDVATNNIDTTKEAGEPNHAENTGGKSVWFSFTPTATKVIRINTTNNTFDTLLAVYTGNTVNNLQLVGYNNDAVANPINGGSSTVDLMMTAGTTYLIAVDGYKNGNVTGEGTFKIALLESDVPHTNNLDSAYNLGTSSAGSIAGTNFNATREANEPVHINQNNPGEKTIWYKWTSSSSSSSMAFELSENFDSQITVYKSTTASPTFAQLTRVRFNIDSLGDAYARYHVRFFAEMNEIYFISVAGHSNNPQLTNSGNFQLKFYPAKMGYSMNSGAFRTKTAITVYRPSEGNWYEITAMGNSGYHLLKWGTNGDTPMAADFTGDGQTEHVIARNENGKKIWYITTTPAATVMHWGLATDRPVLGDFDGDGRADLTVIRNSAQGYIWYVRQSSDGAMRTFNFGTTGDTPVLGDFDGDRLTEVAVVRNTQNGMVWHMIKSGIKTGIPYTQTEAVQFGTTPDVPSVEDYDGDGKTDIAVFRPSSGTWYILRSGSAQLQVTQFGASGDKPQASDYDGDGKADLALFRPSTGDWHFWLSLANNQNTFHWGASGDIPVSSLSTLSQ